MWVQNEQEDKTDVECQSRSGLNCVGTTSQETARADKHGSGYRNPSGSRRSNNSGGVGNHSNTEGARSEIDKDGMSMANSFSGVVNRSCGHVVISVIRMDCIGYGEAADPTVYAPGRCEPMLVSARQ